MVELTKDMFKKLTKEQLKELGESMVMPMRGGAPQPDAPGDVAKIDIKIEENKIINSNPVFCENDKWYFWDETWAYQHGPYKTKLEANKACREYAETL